MDRRHVCGQSKEYLHATVSTAISEETFNATYPMVLVELWFPEVFDW
jgi:hypothetical protein